MQPKARWTFKRVLHAVTDTLIETICMYLIFLVIGAWLYSVFEGKGLWDSFWWMNVTSTTTGYGDMYPVTVAGRLLAIVVMKLSIFLFLPLVIIRLTQHLVPNPDYFSDAEQKWLMDSQMKIMAHLGIPFDPPPSHNDL